MASDSRFKNGFISCNSLKEVDLLIVFHIIVVTVQSAYPSIR